MTTADIQHLREQTGVGMMDAKRALTATNGDMAAAIEHLRKAGQKIAASKSDRTVKEGGIGVWVSEDRKRAAVVALACETDFVARTDQFQGFSLQLAEHLGSLGLSDVTPEQFMEQPGMNGDATVKASLDSMIAKLGENMVIVQTVVVQAQAGALDTYVHASRKIVSVVSLVNGTPTALHDVAMHVAAMNPKYLNESVVPADVVASEEGIYREQLQREGKPEAMWDKILPGKLKKFYADTCLVAQPFVKDDSMTVAAFLKQQGDATVESYIRVAM